jgi:MoaA/NifB/PqqE/SkfB family radical SAM enzyme
MSVEPRDLFDIRISDFFEAAKSGTAGRLRPGRLAEAVLFQRRQAKRRKAAERRGLVVPPILIASLTRRCNLNCAGCYSRALRPSGPEETVSELSDDRFMALFEQAVELGVGSIFLAGDEPLLRRGLVERAARFKGMLLPLFTNGTLIDDGIIDLAAEGSIVPILSIEGEETQTDGRRGPGIHAAALGRMKEMGRRRIMFGASLTITSENADTALDPEFLGSLGGLGISVLFMVEYVPVSEGTDSLIVGDDQRARLNETGRFASLPFPVIVLPGDEEAYGGCLAAGRGFIHLSPEGRIEACPFAPFSDMSAAEHSFEETLSSPMLAAIRERHGELTETKGGCALWNQGGWIASLGLCTGARPDLRVSN